MTPKPAAQRINAWSDARETFKKALEIVSNLRDHGTLATADADLPQKLDTHIADCQRAIEQLAVASRPR
jgi:hypothetical protein